MECDIYIQRFDDRSREDQVVGSQVLVAEWHPRIILEDGLTDIEPIETFPVSKYIHDVFTFPDCD